MSSKKKRKIISTYIGCDKCYFNSGTRLGFSLFGLGGGGRSKINIAPSVLLERDVVRPIGLKSVDRDRSHSYADSRAHSSRPRPPLAEFFTAVDGNVRVESANARFESVRPSGRCHALSAIRFGRTRVCRGYAMS